MTALGYALGAGRSNGTGGALDRPGLAGALTGLEGVAAAVVLIAVIAMGRSLLRSAFARAVAPLAFLATLAIDARAPAFAWVTLVIAGAAAAFLAPATPLPSGSSALPRGSRALGIAGAIALAACLFVLPLFADRSELLGLFVTFFRAGSLVFGGGHVVLPFLQTIVATGRIDEARFLFGYVAVQAIPGPLSTFAAYIGAADARAANMPILAALAALAGIFAPTLFLLMMAAPLWSRIRALPRAGNVLTGLNAAVVGILAAVFVNPIAVSVARAPLAIGIGVAAFALLQYARLPAWAVVLLGAGAGALISR
jgi:chromate transporter